MRKRVLALATLVATLAVATAITVGFAMASGGRPTIEDVGAHVGEHVNLENAAFASGLTDQEAIAIARGFVRDRMHLPNPEELPVKATTARFTGEQQGPKGFTKNLNVRVVVFHQYPEWPRGGYMVKVRPVDPRFTVVIDDGTREVIYSLLSWKVAGQP